MAKRIREVIALILTVCICVSMMLPMQVFATNAGIGDGLGETIIDSVTEDGVTTTTTTTTTTSTDENGTPVLTVQIIETNVEDGANYSKNEVVTATTRYDENGNPVFYSEVTNGTEKDAEASFSGPVTVTIPDEVDGKNTVTTGDPAGTVTTNSDGSTSTVQQQGSVTVETTDVQFSEVIDTENTNMEHVKSETTPTDSNDLVYAGPADEMYLPGYEGEVEAPEGADEDDYGYTYVGSGNTSKLVPAIVFTNPLSEEEKIAQYGSNAYIHSTYYRDFYIGNLPEEKKALLAKDENGKYLTDEEGYIIDINGNRVTKQEYTTVDPDGNTVYLHRFDRPFDGLKVEGWYEDGEWVEELNGDEKYTAVWAGPQQFILVDDKGNVVTTYCADFNTPTQDSYGYNVVNLEDATYYSDEEAKQIRAIAEHGYWGTTEGFGSLSEMKAELLMAGFTPEEVASLTDGVALTATQMAIWSCSNKMSSLEFINSHYSNWGVGNVPADKEDEVKLMFKLYDYLMALEPTELEGTTADTIINEDNFIRDMSVTVVEKAEDHANNDDADDTNDAYVTNLTFALVVVPSTENGDDLVVTVIGSDGRPLATGRIAGEAKEGETVLVPDENGNYCFEGLTLVEGEQNFQLNLTGIQNLKEGVYLYSSEVRTDESGDNISSQTLVGVSSGERGVNVSLDVVFEVSVDDEVIATERVWSDSYETEIEVPDETPPADDYTPPEDPGTTPIPEEPVPAADTPTTDEGDELTGWDAMVASEEIEDEPVPMAESPELETIDDEEVPLADVPYTGDVSNLMLLIPVLALVCLVYLNRKKDNVLTVN